MMKILCIADIHGDRNSTLRALEFSVSRDIENVLILGDFSGHGAFRNREQNIRDAKYVLDLFRDFNPLAIPGNCDSVEILTLFNNLGVNLHERIEVLDGISLLGLGGSNITPFGTPFELEEGEIHRKLKALVGGIETENSILVLHCPPKDTKCDLTGDGIHAGSSAVREIIEKFQPSLCICSHIHESGGNEDFIDKTKVVNIGPISQGRAGIITLSDNIGISLERI
jgi:Icc-related predicted phosphoesterase